MLLDLRIALYQFFLSLRNLRLRFTDFIFCLRFSDFIFYLRNLRLHFID